MGRKELRELVLEEHSNAVCYRPHCRLPGKQDFVIAGEEGIIGEGTTKRAAWKDAAEKLTAAV